jgi:hypothetical protein
VGEGRGKDVIIPDLRGDGNRRGPRASRSRIPRQFTRG